MRNIDKALQAASSLRNASEQARIDNYQAVTGQNIPDARAVLAGKNVIRKTGYEPGVQYNPKGVASFSVTLVRTGIADAGDIWGAVGGPSFQASQYRESIGGRRADYVNMTGGVTAATAAAASDLVFNYPNDTVTVSSTTRDYTSLLDSMFSSMFTVSNTRITVNDPAAAALLFANDFDIEVLSATGRSSENQLNVPGGFSPLQNQALVVDVPQEFRFTPETVLLIPMPQVAFSATLTFTISELSRPV